MTDHKNKDKWLEVFCPDDACLAEEERISLPVSREDAEERSAWLRLFCPAHSCEVTSPTHLP